MYFIKTVSRDMFYPNAHNSNKFYAANYNTKTTLLKPTYLLKSSDPEDLHFKSYNILILGI
jgi:hypothetical protein